MNEYLSMNECLSAQFKASQIKHNISSTVFHQQCHIVANVLALINLSFIKVIQISLFDKTHVTMFLIRSVS